MKSMLAAIAALLLSGCATAQDMTGMDGHGAAGPGMGGMGPSPAGGRICHIVGSGHHLEGTLAFLKAELKIGAAQSSAWEAFASAFASARPAAHGGHGGIKHQGKMSSHDAAPLTGRMAHHEHMMEMHLAHMRKMHAVIAGLYATLGEHEKRQADELIPPFMMCRMHG